MPHKVVQVRRGTTIEHLAFAGASGELTVDTDKNTVVVHDGVTVGGFPLKVEAQEYARRRYLTFRACIVQDGIPSLGFSAPANAPTPIAIVDSSGIITGAAAFTKNLAQTIQDHFMLPIEWVPPLGLEILWRSSVLIGEVEWQVETCGVPIGSSIETASFNEAQSIISIAGAIPYEFINCTMVSLNTTNLEPEGECFFRLTRLVTDTLTVDAELIALRFIVRVQSK